MRLVCVNRQAKEIRRDVYSLRALSRHLGALSRHLGRVLVDRSIHPVLADGPFALDLSCDGGR